MEELKIKYSISQQVKITSILVSIFLISMSGTLAIKQVIGNTYAFVFYASIVGILLGAILILMVTIWQKEIVITIDDKEIDIMLPKQQLGGSISWDTVTQVGIGLGHITIESEPENYKIDLGNLKYNDLRLVKNKIIEVCESKSIAFNNI